MSHWTKLSKYCYVGRIGPSTYFVKTVFDDVCDDKRMWRVTSDNGEIIGDYLSARLAMLAAEEMP
jgi:hypothetical protein